MQALNTRAFSMHKRKHEMSSLKLCYWLLISTLQWLIRLTASDVNAFRPDWPRGQNFGLGLQHLASKVLTWSRKCAIQCKIILVVSISWLYHCNIHYKDVVEHSQWGTQIHLCSCHCRQVFLYRNIYIWPRPWPQPRGSGLDLCLGLKSSGLDLCLKEFWPWPLSWTQEFWPRTLPRTQRVLASTSVLDSRPRPLPQIQRILASTSASDLKSSGLDLCLGLKSSGLDLCLIVLALVSTFWPCLTSLHTADTELRFMGWAIITLSC